MDDRDHRCDGFRPRDLLADASLPRALSNEAGTGSRGENRQNKKIEASVLIPSTPKRLPSSVLCALGGMLMPQF
jgi:hypothetical protein